METSFKNVQLPVIKSGLTKSEIQSLAKEAIDRSLEFGNELQIAEAIAVAETLIKEMKSDDRLRDAVRSEISKYGKEIRSSAGAKLELAETGVKYDFSNCGDVDLIDLYDKMELLKMKIKDREDFLKKVPISGIDMAMQTTGEVVKVYPPSKSSTSSYKITLSK